MSLINEALKKAQKQRETTPGLPPPPVQPPIVANSNPSDEPRRPVRNSGSSKNGVLIAGACAIVAVSVAATVYFLRAPATPASAPAPVSISQPQAAPVAASASSVSTTPTAAPRVAPSGTAIAAAQPSAPVVPTELPRPTQAPAPLVTVSLPAPTAAPEVRPTFAEPTPVKNTLRIQGMIDKFRISGIRLSDTESRVILNDHLFRANDVVESSLGLRLTKIEAHALSFVDADGNSYQKRF